MHRVLPFVLRASTIGTCALVLLAPTAHAASFADTDRDGMSNKWEMTHGFNPRSGSDRDRDADQDGLTNLREFEVGSLPRDEDTDNDGSDDADELRDRTRLRDGDTDDDGTLDGDEDRDHDGVHNEDEDDAAESCRRDDDDADDDHVADEDENDLHLKINVVDTDRDGVDDGAEDRDRDGVANEDEDDHDADACDGDDDHDGVPDEDEEDVYGTVVSFDALSGALVVENADLRTASMTVTPDTEIEIVDGGSGTTADLVAGRVVSEIDRDRDTGDLEEIEVFPALS
jgi:hypothetical protein